MPNQKFEDFIPKKPQNSREFSSLQDLLHRSPRLIWVGFVFFVSLFFVVLILLLLEIYGLQYLQLSVWLRV